jgi:integrase
LDAPAVDDVSGLIKAARAKDDDMVATAIALAAVSGMRRGELCALRWSDVHPQRANVRVSRSLTTRCDQEIGTELVADAYVLSTHADGSQPCLPDTLGRAYWRLAASSAYIPVSTICVISLRRQEGFRSALMCGVDASGRTAMQ